MCEDTKLKAIHNDSSAISSLMTLSSMCEDTKLKAIHNQNGAWTELLGVVFNVRRY